MDPYLDHLLDEDGEDNPSSRIIPEGQAKSLLGQGLAFVQGSDLVLEEGTVYNQTSNGTYVRVSQS